MAERISLEVPASLNALSTVRMVLGGVGARLDFSLDDLDDLYLATDRLFGTALDVEELESLRVAVLVDDGTLRITAGQFRSLQLREQVEVTPGNCIDLCTLLSHLVDDVAVQDDGERFSVVITKSRTESAE